MNLQVDSHPAFVDLKGFLHESLSSEIDSSIAVHLENCSECCQRLDALCNSDDDLESRIKEIHSASTRSNSLDEVEKHEIWSNVPEPIRIGERYRLGQEIGRGGMGIVVQAQDNALERNVVFKILHRAQINDAESTSRFIAEARICSQLQHPGIVPVHDLGRLEDGRPFFAMKQIDGQTLKQILDQREDLEQDRPKLLNIFTQVCQTVAYAHSQYVIHRDLKPQNIMVGKFGEVQVVDWGLAKVIGADNDLGGDVYGDQSEPLSDFETQYGRVMGTPAYMSPEQSHGRNHLLDPRTDVFSLGAILCEILTGKPPYQSDQTDSNATAGARSRQELDSALDRLQSLEVDRSLIDLTVQCLSTSLNHRVANASAVAQRMVAYNESVGERLRESELQQAAAKTKIIEQQKRFRLAAALLVTLLSLVGVYRYHLAQKRQSDQLLHRETQKSEQLGSALESEQHHLTRIMRVSSYLSNAELKIVNDAYWVASRPETAVQAIDNLSKAENIEFSDQDRDLLQRLFESHLWTVLNLDDGALRNKTRIEAAVGYQQALTPFWDWRSPGYLPVPDAAVAFRNTPQPIREAIVDAIDDWIRITSQISEFSKQSPRRWLANLAYSLEENSYRQQLRETMLDPNPIAIRELVQHAELWSQRPAALFFVTKLLDDNGRAHEARRLILGAKKRFPNSLWFQGHLIDEDEHADLFHVESDEPENSIFEFNPPAGTDPQLVLVEARADTRYKRYGQALAKHVWFHRNTKDDRSLQVIRLGVALRHWSDLADLYQPARDELQSMQTDYRCQIVSGKDSADAFRNWRAIVHSSGNSQEIVELFSQLDASHPEIASEIYPVAEPDLLASAPPGLVAKYSVEQRRTPKFTLVRAEPASPAHTKRKRETLLTLINLFVLHGYAADAIEISNDAKQIWSDQAFLVDLSLALKGEYSVLR